MRAWTAAGGRGGGAVRGGATVSALALVPLCAALWAAGAAQCGRGCRGREEGGIERRQAGRRPLEECGCVFGRKGRPVASCFLSVSAGGGGGREWGRAPWSPGWPIRGLRSRLLSPCPRIHTHTPSRVPARLGTPAQGSSRETLCLLSWALFVELVFFNMKKHQCFDRI